MFPIAIMYYFGTNLDQRFAVPGFWPTSEQTHKIPYEREDMDKFLEEARAKRLRLREKRLREEKALEMFRQNSKADLERREGTGRSD